MFKKLGVTCGILAASMLGMATVNAEAYDETDFVTLLTGSTPITANDTLTINGSEYIGANGEFTINEGTVTFSADMDNKRIVMDIEGDVTLNENAKFFIKIPDALEATAGGYGLAGFTVNVAKDSVFDIDGTVAIPAGDVAASTNGIFTNNGTVNVNGALEIRSTGLYDGVGTTNVNGNIAVYGVNGTNIGTDVKFTLAETGAIYSDVAIDSAKILSNSTKHEVGAAVSKDYDSITEEVVTAAGNNTFAYGYELSPIEEEVVVPETPADVDTDKDAEEVTNPKTADGIALTIALALISLGVIGTTAVRLRKNN